ncbi:MAG: hypothetical protein IIB22_00200 [Chloroflexi bacterium]|nr:hypothetical protein [Chloroflexota bacterium]MCH8065338.1 hypothetical protein [Chloroflexota bacterium]
MPEYGAPPQVTPKRLGDYLEVMSKAVFQSGMSWQVVNKKWDGIRDAFRSAPSCGGQAGQPAAGTTTSPANRSA